MVGKIANLKPVKIGLFILVFVFIAFQYLKNLDSWLFQPDEHIYLREGEFLELWVRGDWQHPVWNTFEAFDHPVVGGYVYGASLALSGHWPLSDYFTKIDFNENLNLSEAGRYESFGVMWREGQWWTEATGKPLLDLKTKLPEQYAAMMLGRFTAVGLSLAGFVLVFLWLKQFFPLVVSLLGMVLVALHPVSLSEQTLPRAMLEAPLFFFTALAGYVIALWLKQPDRRPIRWGLVIGLVCALVAGVKLTGLVMVVSLLIYWLLLLTRKLIGWQKAAQFFAFGPAVLASFLGGFIFINPQLYQKPLARLYRFYATRQRFSLWQQYHPVGEEPLADLGSRLQAGGERLLLSEPLFFQYGWANWALVALCLLGLGYLVKKTFQAFWSFSTVKEEFIFWWLVISFWLILSYLPLDNTRYVQPLVVPTVFLQLFGIQTVVFWFRKGEGDRLQIRKRILPWYYKWKR